MITSTNGNAMAKNPRPTRLVDGIYWHDPLAGKGLPVVWEDGVHIVEKVEYTREGIAYILKCGVMFTFFCKDQNVLEAKLNLKVEPTCSQCLE